MKVKHVQTKLFESNESQIHSNKSFWIEIQSNIFKQNFLNKKKVKNIQIKVFKSNEIQAHSNIAF